MTIPVSKESFESADQETKLLLIYDMLNQQHTLLIEHTTNQTSFCSERCEACEARFKALEARRLVNTGAAASGGFIGGMVAIIAKIKFFGS